MSAAVYAAPTTGAIRQGELLSGLVQTKRVVGKEETLKKPRFLNIVHPFAVVLTQDCDLSWDFDARGRGEQDAKLLPNLLFCEVSEAESFRGNRADIKSDIWRRIRTNNDERYQFLEAAPVDADASGEGIRELAIDFKRCFTLPADEVYWQIDEGFAHRRTRLLSPYSDHLQARFANFQSRVALPREHGR